MDSVVASEAIDLGSTPSACTTEDPFGYSFDCPNSQARGGDL